LSASFRRKGGSATNRCWCQKSGVIELSCSIENICSALFGFVTSTRVTDGRTHGQNYDSQDRNSIAASRGNNDMMGLANVAWSQEQSRLFSTGEAAQILTLNPAYRYRLRVIPAKSQFWVGATQPYPNLSSCENLDFSIILICTITCPQTRGRRCRCALEYIVKM